MCSHRLHGGSSCVIRMAVTLGDEINPLTFCTLRIRIGNGLRTPNARKQCIVGHRSDLMLWLEESIKIRPYLYTYITPNKICSQLFCALLYCVAVLFHWDSDNCPEPSEVTFNVRLKSTGTLPAKTLGSTPIRYRSDTKVWDRYIIKDHRIDAD